MRLRLDKGTLICGGCKTKWIECDHMFTKEDDEKDNVAEPADAPAGDNDPKLEQNAPADGGIDSAKRLRTVMPPSMIRSFDQEYEDSEARKKELLSAPFRFVHGFVDCPDELNVLLKPRSARKRGAGFYRSESGNFVVVLCSGLIGADAQWVIWSKEETEWYQKTESGYTYNFLYQTGHKDGGLMMLGNKSGEMDEYAVRLSSDDKFMPLILDYDEERESQETYEATFVEA